MLFKAASLVNERIDWLLDGIDYFAHCIFPGSLNAHVLLLLLCFPLLDLCFIASRELDFGHSEAFVTFFFVVRSLVALLFVQSLVICILGSFFNAFFY